MQTPLLAVETTQWIIAVGSLSSALVALALALGLKDWIYRPNVHLVLREESNPEEISDRVVTKRLETGDRGAFVRVRLDNRGRSTARNVALRLLKMHRWDPDRAQWVRADGRLLQPSNHLATEPTLVDVFPGTDKVVDLASVDPERTATGDRPLAIEITHPWPPNEENYLEPATWRLELMICGDNITAQRAFITLSFDGTWPQPASDAIWQHFLINGPSTDMHGPLAHVRSE